MNAMFTLTPASRGRLVADLYMASVRDHKAVCLEGPDGADRAAVLDRFAAELVTPRTCVLRLRGVGAAELGLTELAEQLAIHVPALDGASDEDGRVLAFSVLTDTAGQYEKVVLIVDSAQCLTPAAARYIDLACQHCGRLRVVLAGPPGMFGTPGQHGMEGLARRVAHTLTMPAITSPAQHHDAGAAPGLPLAADQVIGAPAQAGCGSGARRMAGFSAWSLAGVAAVATLLAWISDPAGQTGTVPVAQEFAELVAYGPSEPAVPALAAEAEQPAAVPKPAVPAPETVAAVPATPPAAQAEADVAVLDLPLPPTPPEPLKARPALRPGRPNPPGVERAALIRTAQPETELCRRILMRAQLGDDASDAERRFMRGGCRP